MLPWRAHHGAAIVPIISLARRIRHFFCEIMEEFLSLPPCWAADHMAHGENANLALIARHMLADIFKQRWHLAQFRHVQEQHICRLRGKVPPRRRKPCRHDGWPGALHRYGIGVAILELEEFPIPIEFRPARQHFGPDAEPFQTMLIALILLNGDAVQIKFRLIPAADDIEPRAPTAHVINRRNRLGAEGGGDDRHMHGGKDRDALCNGCKGRTMRQRFKGFAIDIRIPLIATPFRDRKDEFNAGRIGDLRHRRNVSPIGLPAFRRAAHGQAAIAIGAENTELEFIRAEKRVLRPRILFHGVSSSGSVCGAGRGSARW